MTNQINTPDEVRRSLVHALARQEGQVLTRELAIAIACRALQKYEAPAVLPEAPTKAEILEFESRLLQLDQVVIPTQHYFAPGMYAREVFVAAGQMLTGATHKTRHLITFDGDMTVWTEGARIRLTGHHTLTSEVGAKRVGFAHSDSWCTIFYPTDKTDVAEIERELVEEVEMLQCNRLPALQTLVKEN